MPRIDTISYVTYILGAIGSWIGFSFIGINPIPNFIKIDPNQNFTNGDNLRSFKNILSKNQLEERFRLVEQKFNHRIGHAYQRIMEQDQMIQELKQRVLH